LQATVLVFLAMTLHRLLRQVQQTAAAAMVILVVIGSLPGHKPRRRLLEPHTDFIEFMSAI